MKRQKKERSNYQAEEKKRDDEKSFTSLWEFLSMKYALWKSKWLKETAEVILAMEK